MWPFTRRRKPPVPKPIEDAARQLGYVDRDDLVGGGLYDEDAWPYVVQPDGSPTSAMDSFGTGGNVSRNIKGGSDLGGSQIGFFAAGAQPLPIHANAILATNWLINKACSVPARDALRNGYDLGDGAEELVKTDEQFQLGERLKNFITNGRIYGGVAALYVVSTTTPNEWYENPFNIDGVNEGSYRGIRIIDANWLHPVLTDANTQDPTSEEFYNPTYWRIGQRKIHRSHLQIFTPNPVSDYLRPAYNYLGQSIPHLIMERVYGAERAANEAGLLLMTKRMNVLKLANLDGAKNIGQKLERWVALMNNYGVKTLGVDDEFAQHDTNLGGVDETIMTQYQLVAAASNIPITKLLGTTPKGFNSTGEHDAENYRQTLESMQEHDLTPLLARHYELVAKSEGIELDGPIVVSWEPVDSPTAAERAEINRNKAQAASMLYQTGAIDAQDIRDQLAADDMSDFFGIDDKDLSDDDGELRDLDDEELLNWEADDGNTSGNSQ